MFTGYSGETLDFLWGIRFNNDRSWFAAHKEEYLRCLYQPTLAGLEFFFPRMGRGGVILLSGCSDTRYRGVAKAVEDLESRYGALLMLPVGDLDGTVMIVHP